MYRKCVMVAILGCTLLFAGCSEKKAEVPPPLDKKKLNTTMHPAVKAKDGGEKKGLAEAIKKKTLPAYPAITVGKAFDGFSFFSKREWRETVTSNGKTYVDFIGWFDAKPLDPQNLKNGISAKGVEVKFVVNADGSFFVGMVSRVEVRTDGKLYAYPLPDVKVVLDSIYSGREIAL